MTRPARPAMSFGIGTAVGAAGGLIGLGGAEFRLPALVGALRFSAREAVAVNLVASFIVLAAALPFRAGAVPWDAIAPHLPAVLGMLAGSLSAAWIGAGWLRRISDRVLSRLILGLLVGLGCVLIAEGLFVAEPSRLVGEGMAPTVLVAAACGIVIGLVSSLLGVAGGELIIPVFILLFGVDVKVAGSMSMLVGMPTIAVGLLRHFGAGSVLRKRAVWRATILPLGVGSVAGAILGASLLGLVPSQALKIGLGFILIWSAWGVFRHLPQSGAAPQGLPARVLGHDPEWGLTTLSMEDQTVSVPRRNLPVGAETWLALSDRDVTLALSRAEGTSALNTLAGVVAGVEVLSDGTSARVRVAVFGAGEIAAVVTRRSVAALGLAEGLPVLARFKATAVR